ncbi:MAG: glycosyltransferase [Candidatus Yanofskybacteria bacterium]|nr:glycosyltransferase [Candidatus Yanofskybacteria bacterium]
MNSTEMLKKVLINRQVKPRDFLKFVAPKQKAELLKVAAAMRGKRVVHVSATAIGGGVAEILNGLIPYLRSLGIESDWYTINPRVGKRFFTITNKLHNSLQGSPVKLTEREWNEYEKVNKRIAGNLEMIDCDILAINDPQPLGAGVFAHLNKHKIYISHIDTSSAFKPVWRKVLPLINNYHRAVFSNRAFINGAILKNKVRVFTPAIDPLVVKQTVVSRTAARRYLKRYGGVPKNRPLIAQVSRFDIWKNPLGVIEAFRLVQNTFPKALLVLAGFHETKDNPAAIGVYSDIKALSEKAPDIFLFFDPRGKKISEFTAMIQNGADVIVQNSIKEGFGLVVTEAMWKSQPVIGGPADGLRVQIKNGKNGFIVKTPQELAEKIVHLLEHPAKKKIMGKAARETVIRKFLLPRLVADHIKLYLSCIR